MSNKGKIHLNGTTYEVEVRDGVRLINGRPTDDFLKYIKLADPVAYMQLVFKGASELSGER